MKHTPRKRFGQNFLHDQGVIGDIIDAIDAQSTDHVVEIGPGHGALTYPLLSTGCQLHVIELDRDLAAYWRTRQSEFSQLNVHQADALKVDFAALAPEHRLRLVGNLPYNISTPLLFHFLAHRERFTDLHVMLQKEVAERLCAGPGSKIYGRLTVMLAVNFDCEILFEIAPEAFAPQPRVTSAFVRIQPVVAREFVIHDAQAFATVVRQAFSQRRKTLRKSLGALLTGADFEACSIDSGLRPEALSTREFARLANRLAHNQVHAD